jgi:guanylate kinase
MKKRVKNSDARIKRRPLLIVLSAPAGCGKTTLARMLLADLKWVRYSTSCTTRKPRGKEKHGVHYHFLTDRQYDAYVKRGKFLEYATVYGNKYGTLKKTVYDVMKKGNSILLVIDIQGSAEICRKIKKLQSADPLRKGFINVFIKPPSISTLKQRMERRGEDDTKTIMGRLKIARNELKQAGNYKYVIVNDNLRRAYGELRAIINEEAGKQG